MKDNLLTTCRNALRRDFDNLCVLVEMFNKLDTSDEIPPSYVEFIVDKVKTAFDDFCSLDAACSVVELTISGLSTDNEKPSDRAGQRAASGEKSAAKNPTV